MKKLKYLCSAFLIASLLAIPAAARKHGMGQMGHRNNTPRAQKKDNDKGKQNPDRDKAKGKAKAKGETNGEQNGHREH